MKAGDASLKIVSLVAGLVIAYLLSPPFVAATLGKRGTYKHEQILETIYAPAGWLHDHCPPYQAYIEYSFAKMGIY